MINIRLLTTIAEMEILRPAWQALLAISDCHRTFASPTWFLTTIEVFTELQPWLWVAEEDGHLLGIAPLVIHAGSRKISLTSELADYQDFIVAKGDTVVTTILLKAILSKEANSNRFLLSGLRRNSNLRLAFESLRPMEHDGLPFLVNEIETCYYADVSDGYESYIHTRNANFRFNLRKAQRRAREAQIEVLELGPQDISGPDIAEHFLRLHLLRFPDKLFSRAKPQQFCRLILPRLFDLRTLRVFVLRDHHGIMAIHLAVTDVNALGIWNGGFDSRASAVSPGKILINKQIQVCAEEGLARFDFLRGDETYKKSWSSNCQAISQITINPVQPT
jgi:CelD/BcsL family acetyltransferase involved in cellulose biosynthesis